MTSFKSAWNQAMKQKKSFFLFIGLAVAVSFLMGLWSLLLNWIFGKSSFLTFFLSVLNFCVSYFLVVSAFHILKETVVDQKPMDFQQMITAFFEYPWKNLKTFAGTYLIWFLAIPFVVELLIGVFCGVFIVLIASLLGYGSIEYYLYYFLNDPFSGMLGGATVLILLMVFLFLALNIFTVTIEYYGLYKLGAIANENKGYKPSVSECLKLGLVPLAIVAISVALAVVLILLAALLGLPAVLVVLIMSFLIVLCVAICVFALIYRYAAMVKILMDTKPSTEAPMAPPVMNPNHPVPNGGQAVPPVREEVNSAPASNPLPVIPTSDHAASEKKATPVSEEKKPESINPYALHAQPAANNPAANNPDPDKPAKSDGKPDLTKTAEEETDVAAVEQTDLETLTSGKEIEIEESAAVKEETEFSHPAEDPESENSSKHEQHAARLAPRDEAANAAASSFGLHNDQGN